MSGWFQGFNALSNLREQASEIAQEIFSENVKNDEEGPDDNQRMQLLENKIEELNGEIVSLRQSNEVLLIRATSAERRVSQQQRMQPLQIETVEFDIPTSRRSSKHSSPAAGESELLHSPKSTEFEIKKLNDEIKELKAECVHWKGIAKSKDIASYEREIEELKNKLEEKNKFSSESDWDNWTNDYVPEVKLPEEHDQGSKQSEIDHIFEQNQSLEAECCRLRQESELLTAKLSSQQGTLDRNHLELTEMGRAYEELNRELEQERVENGRASEDNRQLEAKLESLKGDIIQYEERYELCKADNEKAVAHLNDLVSNFEKLKTELANTKHTDVQTMDTLKERLEHVTTELSESMEKRQELAQDVGQFEGLVESFRQKLEKLDADNDELRRENDRLTALVEDTTNARQILQDTESNLESIRRKAKETELCHLKLELELRQELERLNEENFSMTKQMELLRGVRSPPCQSDELKSINTTNTSSGHSSSSADDVDEHFDVVAASSPSRAVAPKAGKGKSNNNNKGSGASSPFVHVDLATMTVGVAKGDVECQTDDDGAATNDWTDADFFQTGQEVKDASTKLVELERLNDELQESLEDKDKEIHHLDRLVVNMGKEIEELTSKLDEQSRCSAELVPPVELETLTNVVQASDNDKFELLTKLENIQAEYAACKECFEEKDQEIQRLRQQIAEGHLEMNERESKFELELKSTLESLENGYQSQIDCLKSELDRSRTECESLLRSKQELLSKLDCLEKELGDISAKSDVEFLAIESLKSDYEQKLKTTQETANEMCENFQKDNETLRREIQLLQAEQERRFQQEGSVESNSETELESLLTQLECLKVAGASLMQENSQLQSEIGTLQNHISTSESNFHVVREEYQSLITRLKSELKESTLQMNELNSKLVTLENERSASFTVSQDAQAVDKLNLEEQVQRLESEKQQLVILINQKHEESLNFYQQWQEAVKTLNSLNNVSKLAVECQTAEDWRDWQCSEISRLVDELKLKDDRISVLESGLASKGHHLVVEMEQLKHDMNRIIQSKDRATSELFAERQRAEKLAEQLKLQDDTCQKYAKEVERLKKHLMHIEEAYTAEAVKAEERETDLRQKLKAVEDQLFSQSDMTQGENQKLNEQLINMRNDFDQLVDERDRALTQLSDIQLELEQSQNSTKNLQNVLLQFQREKEGKSGRDLERHKQEVDQLIVEKNSCKELAKSLEEEVQRLKELLSESTNVSIVLHEKDVIISEMKNQLVRLEQQCSTCRDRIVELEKVRDGKIDKEVLKNVVLGYFSAPADKKSQVAGLLGSILGFSPDELKKCQASTIGWLGFLSSSSGPAGSNLAAHSKSAEASLASQFVKFLETESQPKNETASQVRSLLTPSTSSRTIVSPVLYGSRSSTPSPSTSANSPPTLVGLQVELPTFQEVRNSAENVSRSSSSVDFLKSVLQ